MSRRVTLECSHDDLHAIYMAVEHTRKSANVVKVPKKALEALLRDQAALIAYHRQYVDGVV